MLLDHSTLLQLDEVEDLKAHLLGDVVRPTDADYDTARTVWNASVDRHPQLVVRAADAADVIRVVSFARRHNLQLAVRSGGHSFTPYGWPRCKLDCKTYTRCHVPVWSRTHFCNPAFGLVAASASVGR